MNLYSRGIINLRTATRVISSRYFSQKDHVVGTPIPDVNIPNLLLHEFVWKNLDKWHDKIAVECAETRRKFTYNQIHKMSNSLAGFLQKAGFGKGDTAAIILPNVPEYFVVILGALQAGLTLTTINPIYTTDEIKRQLIDSESKIIFTLCSLHNNIPNLQIPTITIKHLQTESSPVGSIKFDEICCTNFPIKDPEWKLDDVAVLPYSSGTTGLPKGVELTHRNFVSNFAQSMAPEMTLLEKTEGAHQDVIPVVLPMFHIYGFTMVALATFLQGVKLITVPKFGSQIFFDVIYNYSPSVLYIVPPIVLLILNNPNLNLEKLGSLRTIVSGAAPLGASDIERFRKTLQNKVHLIQKYGLTECTPLTHGQSFKLNNGIKIGGSGFPLSNTLCKIVNVDDPNAIGLGPNISGELLIKGPQVMKGYFKNPESTTKTFVGDRWLRTGDIGHYDDDGHFFITDRLKELIKVKGFQVAPAELEALLRNHPDIQDAAVSSVPDKDCGEVPKAFIVLRNSSKCSTQDISNYIAEKVAPYKRLAGGVTVLDAIPRNASGKILRKKLKEMC